jgi:hypothetical protein
MRVSLMQVNIPLRFIFLLLTPEKDYNMTVTRLHDWIVDESLFNVGEHPSAVPVPAAHP